jgi:hypothetical protein
MKVRYYTHVSESRRPHSPDGQRLEWQTSRYESLQARPPDPFCCAAMRDAWADGWVGFGEKDFTFGNEDTSVNLYRFEWELWRETPIQFCPWCGERIETEKEEGAEDA